MSTAVSGNIVAETELREQDALANRATWADLCRVVSIYGVILIHSCGATFYSFGKAPLADWLAANALDSLARVSVPLFVMLSGALLLKPGAPVMALSALPGRVGKVLVPLLVWSAFYLYRNTWFTGGPIDWPSLLRQPAMYHLWFGYMIIGVYLLLPFLQAIYEGIRSRPSAALYFFVVWTLIGSLPLYLPIPLLDLMQQTSLLGYGGYFIAGALLAHGVKDGIPTIAWAALYGTCSMTTFLLTWYFSAEAGTPSELPYAYLTLNVIIASFAAFKVFTRASAGPAIGRILHWVGDRSFLIFFVHVLVLEYVRFSSVISALSQNLHVFFVILVISVATFLLSLMLAAAIRLVPGASRVFG